MRLRNVIPVVLVGVAVAGAALALAPPSETQRSPLGLLRAELVAMAGAKNDEEFLVAYHQWLTQHHLHLALRKGLRQPVGGGCSVIVYDENRVRLENDDHSTEDFGTREFVRGATAQGRWTSIGDQAAGEFAMIVIRTKGTIFYVSPDGEMMMFDDLRPERR